MFEALIVTLREGIEAALVIGIILIYLRKTGRAGLSRWVFLGLFAGLGASVACAAVFAAIGLQEEAYEGWLMIAGAVLVATLVIWMLRTAKRMKSEIESRVETIAGRGEGAVAAGLFSLTFVLILREGIETVLFLAAVNLTTDALMSFVGGIAGILVAVLFGIAFVRGNARVDLQRFFKVTAIVLFLLSAQLLIGGLHEMGERGTIPIGRDEMLLIGPIVKNDVILLVSLLALPLIVLLVPGRGDKARLAEAQALEGPERRLALAGIRRERIWRRLFGVAGIAVIASLTVSYAFLRLPSGIDPPALLTPDADGMVRVQKAGLLDGHLHRYGVSVDGTVARFFVLGVGSKLRPAFDACEVCGAYGYVFTKGRLVCLACAADINVATVGTGGGCNPLPLPYRDEDGALVFAVGDLRKHVKAFKDALKGEASPPGS